MIKIPSIPATLWEISTSTSVISILEVEGAKTIDPPLLVNIDHELIVKISALSNWLLSRV